MAEEVLGMMKLDFSKICRVCMNEADFLMPIFRVHISKKMMACASVQVWEKDGLPSQICNKCVAQLYISYQFKKQCEKSDAKLRQYLIDVPIKLQRQTDQTQQITIKQPLSPKQNDFEFLECTSSKEMDTTEQQYDTNLVPTDTLALTQINYDVKPVLNDIPNSDYILHPTGEVYSEYIVPPKVEPGQILATLLQRGQTFETIPPPDVKEEDLDQQQEECPTCGKEFSTGAKLRHHMKMHTTTTLHKCEYCHKTFTLGSSLKKHLLIHSNERAHGCTVCSKRFRTPYSLQKHKRVHTGERPYPCSYCPRAFSSSSTLIGHIRTHTGEKPYVCCVCQKAFCQSTELTKHMRTHTGEKSHTCNLCHKSFTERRALINHTRTHTGERPYICKTCNKGFAQSSYLAEHVKRHIGEKNFKCDTCDGAFVTRKDLRAHTLMHARNKNDCSICGKSFSTTIRLNNHVNATHLSMVSRRDSK